MIVKFIIRVIFLKVRVYSAHAQRRHHAFAAQCQVGLHAQADLQRSYPEVTVPFHCEGTSKERTLSLPWRLLAIISNTSIESDAIAPLQDRHSMLNV